ncbi:MAG: CRTAC1 family protein [Acidobacteriota bacterium]|nr:CRTAC1 family protein [Acidobacteriota bacterium]
MKFDDITRAAGIDFHLTCGDAEKRFIMESLCGGIAVFDYDNDGWMDIFLVNGSTLADLKSGKCHSNKLYRNNHDGTFSDVTAKAGLQGCGWGFGATVGDYDNDGWEDILVTYLDHAALYHNNGNGSFTDVTAKAGVGNSGHWGTSAAFGDYDNDGYLDLYIANYVDLDVKHLPEFGNGPFCQYRGIPVSCGPRGLPGGPDRLYHNNGDGTFTDVTEKLNIDQNSYYGLGVLWLDYDMDGCLDLYVADDSSPSMLYHNDCKGGFTEVGVKSGVAFNSDGHEQAGMGIDAADYDNDGWPDIVKTNFSDDSNNLYHNDGNGEFTDRAATAKFGPVSIPFLGFGVKFLDLDNDGWKDIFVANGHVNPQVDQHSFGVTYAERPLLFHNLRGTSFTEVGMSSGESLARHYVARGTATADFFNVGVEDLLVSVLGGSPLLLRNVSPRHGHWLRIKTVGTHSNHDGFGARVTVKVGTLAQTSEVRTNSSFESASDPRLHFGLGTASVVDSIVIRWPSGKVETAGPEAADQALLIEEGHGVVARTKGSPPSGDAGRPISNAPSRFLDSH